MIYIVQNDNIYEVSFKYDLNIINHVKNVPGRRWLPDKKIWTIPKDRLGFLINEFKGTSYYEQLYINSDEAINVNSTLDNTSIIPDIDISDVPFHVKSGCTPMQHQYDFMKYAINRQNNGNMNGFLLCDEQGLAKSAEVLNLAVYNKQKYKFKHCLIICCINSSKYNWKDEIDTHLEGVESGYILGTRCKRDGSFRSDTGSVEKLEDLESGYMYNKQDTKLPYFLILNIEALRYKVGKKYKITEKIIQLIKDKQINMIAIDEIHKNASPSSAQGKQLIKIKKETQHLVEWIPITGTPITNKPTDVFLPLKLIDAHDFSSFYIWCNQFCIYGGFGGYEIVGYKNISYLKSLVQDNMLRRLKSDVLDLPPKMRYTEYVENSAYQQKLYKTIQSELKRNKDNILRSLNPMVKFLKLRQVNGNPELVSDIEITDPNYLKYNAKLSRLLELLEEIHDRNEKVVIMSNWVESLRTLYNFISVRYNTCCFTGTMKEQTRQKHKYVFQNNPKYTVMLGTIGALGTTHTLTAATNLIFYDEPWTPSDKEQAEDRIYRIGTSRTVNIYTLITKDTVDDRVHHILYTKSNVSKYIVDNKVDLKSNPELFDSLLS